MRDESCCVEAGNMIQNDNKIIIGIRKFYLGEIVDKRRVGRKGRLAHSPPIWESGEQQPSCRSLQNRNIYAKLITADHELKLAGFQILDLTAALLGESAASKIKTFV